jgi:PAS domain S-box-containing protein
VSKIKPVKDNPPDVTLGKFLLELYEKALHLPEKELYNYFIDHAVSLTKSKIGFFHFVSDDQKSIILTTWNKEALKNCTASYATNYSIDQAGNWADCVRFNHPIIYNDFKNSPNQKGLPEGHVSIRRMLSIPISENGKVQIIFGVGNKVDPYAENDVVQLELVANEFNKVLKQRRFEDQLRESEEKYRSLFANMLDGFAYCKMIFDEKGNPSDFIYLEVNEAFERLTGLKKNIVIGKKVTKAIPGIKEANPELFNIYAKVAQTGKKEKFELFFKPLSIWLAISVYSPRKGYFAAVFENITERKNTENALQESEQRWSTTLESIGDAVISTDVNGKITFMNVVAEKLTGWTFEEVVGKPLETVFNVVNEFTRMKAEDPVSKVLEKGLVVGLANHSLLVRKDKSEVAIDDSGAPIRDRNGKIKGVVLVFRDITERKKAEDELRKSEERYRSFIEVTGELGWTANPDGEVIEDILSFRNYSGQSYDEVKGLGWSKAIHPDDLENTINVWKKALATKNKYEVEYRLRRRDGQYRHFLARGVPVFNKDGSITEWVGSCIDVSNLKEMEKELLDTLEASQSRQSEISALLEASKAVLQYRDFRKASRFIFDSCKDLLGASAGYVALLSQDGIENEVLFLDSGQLACSVDSSLPMPVRGLRAEAYKTGKAVFCNDFANSDFVKLMPKGHVALKNVLFSPLTIEKNTVGLLGLANKPDGFTERDVQMAKAFGEIASIALINSRTLAALEKNEKMLKMHTDQLEKLVEERTLQLKDAERLSAIGQTAGMVGHDIRNPLQAIVGDLYLANIDLSSIAETPEKASLLESLLAIQNNVEYISKIVADLQDFAKPLKPLLEDTNLESIINDLMAHQTIPSNIVVTVNLSKEATIIKSDFAFIKRIVGNLISNAVQAMPDGGKLTICTYLDNGDIILTVEDTGAGIAEEVKPKLFQPLFTTKSKGQGFGLAVVKRLTEALGGTVTFESQAGKGTKFILRFPSNKNLKLSGFSNL